MARFSATALCVRIVNSTNLGPDIMAPSSGSSYCVINTNFVCNQLLLIKVVENRIVIKSRILGQSTYNKHKKINNYIIIIYFYLTRIYLFIDKLRVSLILSPPGYAAPCTAISTS